MTPQEKKTYLIRQINIIATKETVDELNRYQALLHQANIRNDIKNVLLRACDAHRQDFTMPPAMAEHGELMDILEEST